MKNKRFCEKLLDFCLNPKSFFTNSGKSKDKNTYLLSEGNTGVLSFNGFDGLKKTAIPNYDLDMAHELLVDFQSLCTLDGTKITEAYIVYGFNWYPSVVSFIYWKIFFPYIKYNSIIQDLIDEDINIVCIQKKQFYHYLNIMDGSLDWNRFQDRLFNSFIKINNRILAFLSKAKLLFFRFAVNDFRSKDILSTLDKLGANYIEVVPSSTISNFIQNIMKGKNYYYFGRRAAGNRFNINFDLSKYDEQKKRLYGRTIDIIETQITSYIIEYQNHVKTLNSNKFDTFYGFDDVNGYIFPILYACHTLGIRKIAHQHGAYAKRQAGWIMEGIKPEHFVWFDKLIVWGEYWKKFLLNNSDVYSDDFFIIGTSRNKLICPAFQSTNPDKIVILIPYEFLANTYKIGLYIEGLVLHGYDVWFKARPDEDINDQLDSYMLSDRIRSKITVLYELDEGSIRKVNIVAGTMTVMLYEFLALGKIIWILDTEYRHMDDMVDYGFAHKIKLDDIENIKPEYFKQKYMGESSYFFASNDLEDVIRVQVLS